MEDYLVLTSKNSSTKDELGLVGNREDRIRTCDTLVPNQVLYQAELLPVANIKFLKLLCSVSPLLKVLVK